MSKPKLALPFHPWRVIFALFATVCLAAAQTSVKLAWSANPETNITGYRLHWGTTPSLGQTRTVGNVTTVELTGLAQATTYHAALQALNSSGHESPISAQISFTTGVATFPEIAISDAGGNELLKDPEAVSWGPVPIGQSGVPLVYGVTNEGTADLTGIDFEITGPDAGDFAVIPPSASALAPGIADAFSVVFSPGSEGIRQATLSISSNDADESPFLIPLRGIGTLASGEPVPGVSVGLAGGATLDHGSAAFDFGSLDLLSSAAGREFTITSSGNTSLESVSVSVVGEHASDFSIATAPPVSLASGESASLTVSFKPNAIGPRNAVLRIVSNDATRSPFGIALTGTGLSSPEIEVELNDGTPLTDGVAVVAFGSLNVGASGTSNSLVIRSVGSAGLSGLSLGITGANPGDFSISSIPSTLASGGDAAFTVTFKPLAAGTRGAILRIASNDADENPFDITLSGTGVAVPEIAVELAGGAALTDGAASVAFASSDIGSTGHSNSFVIRSTGSAGLSGLALSLAGSHLGDFTVSSIPASLATGGSTSFTVTFKPTAAGSRSAILRIASNDADENPFDITLAGTGVAVPEIGVELANGTTLADGTASVAFGSSNLGSSGVSNSLVVRSTGSASLSGLSLSLAGSHPGDFTVSSIPASLATGGSTSFTVTFKPLAAGSRSAILRIASNDADENPFDITLTGTGAAVPEIVVELANGTVLADGSASVAFGSSNLGSSGFSNSFVIRSSGSASLSGLSLGLVGSNPGDFSVSSIPATLATGANTSFTVTFKPLAAGTRSAILRIASNDADENPFDITLSGTGVAVPEIAVELGNGTALADGTATVAFGPSNLGSPGQSNSLVIRSTGSAGLSGLAFSLVGSHPGDFTVSSIPATLATGGSTSFTVTFKPLAAGSRSAVLRIASNDADENPFDITLGGTGVAVPEIAVKGPTGSDLKSNVSIVGFGSQELLSPGETLSFAIHNPGSASLTGIRLTVSGSHAADFTVHTAPSPSVAAGSTSEFAVIFRPNAAGSRTAQLHIASNDADETPFIITLSGNATATPEIEITHEDGTTDVVAAGSLHFGAIDLGSGSIGKPLILHNRGTGSLTSVTIGVAGAHAGDFSVERLPSPNIAPGARMPLTVRFNPLAGGLRSAVLTVSSNDPDEATIRIPLAGNSLTYPEIAISDAKAGLLTDSAAALDFGDTPVGDNGASRVFVIRNTGNGSLTRLKAAVEGANSREFRIINPLPAAISPGNTAMIRVQFSPLDPGRRIAALRITSNDADESSFSIPLTGDGVPVPRIEVRAAGSGVLEDGDSVLAFGASGRSSWRAITIINRGSAPLAGISPQLAGPHAADFRISGTVPAALAPGDSATLRIEFKPRGAGLRWGSLRVASNDARSRVFDVVLSGRNGSLSKRKSAAKKAVVERPAPPVVSVVNIGGERFRCLTIVKSADSSVSPSDIQVSGNLVDWKSGHRHVVVVTDNASILKVRDAIPLKPGIKRHIRLKPGSGGL